MYCYYFLSLNLKDVKPQILLVFYKILHRPCLGWQGLITIDIPRYRPSAKDVGVAFEGVPSGRTISQSNANPQLYATAASCSCICKTICYSNLNYKRIDLKHCGESWQGFLNVVDLTDPWFSAKINYVRWFVHCLGNRAMGDVVVKEDIIINLLGVAVQSLGFLSKIPLIVLIMCNFLKFREI